MNMHSEGFKMILFHDSYRLLNIEKEEMFMPVIDEIKEQQKKVKDMSLKKKVGYFWHYYRIHVIVGIIVLAFIGFFIRDFRESSREEVLNVTFINQKSTINVEKMKEDFASYINLDTEKYQIFMDGSMTFSLDDSADYQSNMATQVQLIGLTQSNDLDIIITDKTTFDHLAGQEFFVDIETYLPQELLEKINPSFYRNSISRQDGSGEITYSGLLINDSPLYKGIQLKDDMVLGVLVNTKHQDNILRFLEFFYNYSFDTASK